MFCVHTQTPNSCQMVYNSVMMNRKALALIVILMAMGVTVTLLMAVILTPASTGTPRAATGALSPLRPTATGAFSPLRPTATEALSPLSPSATVERVRPAITHTLPVTLALPIIVQPGPTPTPTLFPNVPKTILPVNLGGLHIEAVGDHTGYEDLLRVCTHDDRPLALVKVLGDGYSAKLAKQADPRTVTIWRKPTRVGHQDYMDNPPDDWTWPADQTAERARTWLEAMYPDWQNQREYIDYFEIVNEPNMATVTQTLRAADFMLEAMKLAETHDPPYHLAIWSFSSGTPELSQAQLISPTLKYAAEHGHILSVHDGSVDGERRLFKQAYADGTALRYRMFQPLLGKSMPRVAITEAYQPDGYKDPDWYDWQWYLNELAKDNVIGAAWFTLGPYSFGGGEEVNVVKQLPAFAQMLGCR
jgi:hypothetical protein